MPQETRKGWVCNVCEAEFYYESECREHEEQCLRAEAEEHDSRLDDLETRVATIEKKLGISSD